MIKVFSVVSIHSCPGQQIGLGNSGGLSIYVINLIYFLIKKKQKVFLICKKHKNCNFAFSNKNFKLIHVDPQKRNSLSDEIIRDTNVLISNYWTSGVFSKIFESNHNLLKINVSHTLEYLKKEHSSDYKIDSKRINVEKSIFEFFDYTLSFSKLEESVLKNKYKLSPNKIINSTPGFNKEYFFHEDIIEARKRIGFENNETKLILFVGRNDYLKGLDIAVDAFKKVESEVNSIKLGIVGGDLGSVSQKKFQKEIIGKKYSNKIIWFGSVPQEKLRNYYNSSNLVIIPSRSETFGIVCLEAISSKTPVIASNTGRMKDFIEIDKTGVIINNITPNDFARNIIKFFENDNCFSFEENYYEKIKQFEWDKVFKDLYKFIE